MRKQINPNELTYKGNLNYDLSVKFKHGSELIETAQLLKTNGIAEEVFLKKFPEKPYTWIANVISVAVGMFNSIPVGATVRAQYEKSGQIFIPPIVSAIPLAEANTLLPEIHRRVWKNLLPHQEIICKYCGQKAVVEIELDKLEFDAEDKLKLAGSADFEYLYVDLEEVLELTEWVKSLKKEAEYAYLMNVGFNRLVFRIPTLKDAIKHERFATTDGLKFWRKIAFECLMNIQAVSEGNDPENPGVKKVDCEVPTDTFVWLGEALLNKYLGAEDLAQIRHTLREEIPTLPFAYEDLCPNCNRETPYIMEASAFFSE
jgi:hypothetical protein